MPTTLDIHCHVHVPEAEALVASSRRPGDEPLAHFASTRTREVNVEQMRRIAPQLTDITRRLGDMDAAGIDVQAICPGPDHYCYWATPPLGLQVARVVNDRLAQIERAHPGRFVALGTVPLQDPEAAAAELERCVGTLGMRGVEINTDVQGRELSRAGLEPFFARAEALGAVLFMHPTGYSDGRRLSDHYLVNVIGNPLSTTVAVHYLILDGLLSRHPALKLVLAHGGGFIGAYSGRLDHAHRARRDLQSQLPADQLPSDLLRALYVDTVTHSVPQLEYLVEHFGADHVLLGTDYPYDMADEDPVGTVASLSGLSPTERTAILGGNARALLGLA
jgi:aminocarboxymuconate-semialdehyde decarboxylase